MIDSVDDILEEYVESRLQFEEEPYWLYLDNQDELKWGTFAYFPEAHYNREISKRVQNEWKEEVLPDGGTTNLHQDDRRTSVYYWLNPDTGAALYHTEANGDEANPFFKSETAAEHYLEKRAPQDEERFEGMSLYKARVQKVEDAVDVLTNQSGLTDFAPDGGRIQ